MSRDRFVLLGAFLAARFVTQLSNGNAWMVGWEWRWRLFFLDRERSVTIRSIRLVLFQSQLFLASKFSTTRLGRPARNSSLGRTELEIFVPISKGQGRFRKWSGLRLFVLVLIFTRAPLLCQASEAGLRRCLVFS